MLTDQQLIQELERRFTEKKESLDQMQKLTQELKEVNKKLEESEALKTHFISNITNEIINPFAAILGLSRSILDVKKENWEKVISMVHLIHSEAFNLDFQLKNIFAAARMEAGEWVPEIMNVDVNYLINSTFDGFKYEAAKKNVSLEYDLLLSPGVEKTFCFPTDAEKLKIVLSNLVSNAIKYSLADGIVTIEAKLHDNELLISVIDRGVGVSEENKKIIFDRFSRIDTGINSINRGHGLGLSVNKAIMDLLNGSIDMNSTPYEKTVFTIKLPPGQLFEASRSLASDGNEFLFDNDAEEIF
ncbi:MAG: sensor histidine kinase [Bacteroidota bacterium]